MAIAANDSSRIRISYEIEVQSWIIRTSYWDSMISDAHKHGMKDVEASARNNIGFVYKNQGNSLKGLAYYHKSLKLRKEIEDNEGMTINLIKILIGNH